MYLPRVRNLFFPPNSAVEATGVIYLSMASKSIASYRDTRFDTPLLLVSYPLDFNLRRVAKLRQVSIKTARCWRDSENLKWFLALEDLARFRKERGRDIIDTERRSFFDELNLAELEMEQSRREILEAEVVEVGLAELASLPCPSSS